MKDNTFWKKRKHMSRCSSHGNVLAKTVGEAKGESNIADMWQKHYTDLLNSNKDTGYRQIVFDSIKKFQIWVM